MHVLKLQSMCMDMHSQTHRDSITTCMYMYMYLRCTKQSH